MEAKYCDLIKENTESGVLSSMHEEGGSAGDLVLPSQLLSQKERWQKPQRLNDIDSEFIVFPSYQDRLVAIEGGKV